MYLCNRFISCYVHTVVSKLVHLNLLQSIFVNRRTPTIMFWLKPGGEGARSNRAMVRFSGTSTFILIGHNDHNLYLTVDLTPHRLPVVSTLSWWGGLQVCFVDLTSFLCFYVFLGFAVAI